MRGLWGVRRWRSRGGESAVHGWSLECVLLYCTVLGGIRDLLVLRKVHDGLCILGRGMGWCWRALA